MIIKNVKVYTEDKEFCEGKIVIENGKFSSVFPGDIIICISMRKRDIDFIFHLTNKLQRILASLRSNAHKLYQPFGSVQKLLA